MIKFAAAAAVLALAGSAHAAVTFTSTPFDAGVPAGRTLVDDFTAPIASGYSLTGGVVEQGTTPGYAAAPAGDTSNYLAVTKDQYATLSSDRDLSALSVYIGSIDAYNYIAFAEGTKLVQLFTGAQLVPGPISDPNAGANGDQSSGMTNRLFDFDLSAAPVNTVYFGSTDYSFEFDNIAATTVSAAPEPSSWALMIAGVGLIGATLRWGRRQGATPVQA